MSLLALDSDEKNDGEKINEKSGLQDAGVWEEGMKKKEDEAFVYLTDNGPLFCDNSLIVDDSGEGGIILIISVKNKKRNERGRHEGRQQ
jgi:hypothetical protein